MTFRPEDDPRPAEALALDIARIADDLGVSGLVRAGRELIGPCPQCGGRDRFSINTAKRVFNCRKCGGTGGNIDLVMFVRSCPFPQALEFLVGERQQLTQAEVEDRARRAAENKRRNEARAAHERQQAIAGAREIWRAGQPAEGTSVRGYLTARGIPRDLWPTLPPCLRFHPDLAYVIQIDGRWTEIHRGPAMLAAIQGPDDRFQGVHRTWIDLDQPKGKPRILDPRSGEPVKVKKSLGSVKGGAIRLTPARPTMVMGEGIETTATALIADVPSGAGYWAGVSLGNMAGQRMLGPGLKYAGIPDMQDSEAFVPPIRTDRLIFIQDGDSDPRLTLAQLQSGLRRAMARRPGLRGQIVHAGQGVDLNDILMGAEQ